MSICTDVKLKPARGVLPQGGRFDPLERSPYLSCNFNPSFPWQDYLQMISFLSFLVFLKPIKCYLHVKGRFRKFIRFGLFTRPKEKNKPGKLLTMLVDPSVDHKWK